MPKRRRKPADIVAKNAQRAELDELRKRNAELAAQVERQSAEMSALRKSKFKLPKSKRARPVGKSWIRLFVPDLHGAHLEPDVVSAFLADAAALQPREVIGLGDVLEAGGFLAQHHVWGFVAETTQTFQDDVNAANQFLDQLQRACPRATFTQIEGNHDQRIEKWCVTQALRSTVDAGMLLNLFGPQSVLSLEKRGIRWVNIADKHDGLAVRGTIKLGPLYVTHGTKHGKRAGDNMLARYGGNVMFGHVHKLLAATDNTVENGMCGAWCAGYLGKKQPLWKHSDPTDWTHGYTFQVVRPDLSFLTVQVPIVDGVSMLGDWK